MATILVISGLDPSAGAGFLADTRVACELGIRAVGVITAHTIQDTQGVREVVPVSVEVVEEQLRALLSDVEVHSVKIGMLGDAGAACVVARALAATAAPVVWDPVLMPSRGGTPLLIGDVSAATAALLPEVRVVVPNLAEAAALTGIEVRDLPGMREAAKRLRQRGARAVLVKGGHLMGPHAIDVLDDGGHIHELHGERFSAGPLHGTGCVLSTAIACALATGDTLERAARKAKDYVVQKLRAPLRVGRGASCLV
ncbi:MAG: bifunctional hydroxymethylpyrimidine kinase/phosphomethylpyrimidine kinase [Deltaproteobacteria bacterium]|nr:bifunctional hydroxymethylpyrimidine kinase/phosphomethylpyrimidine kinase [Deltaproteobacteria bacterium]